MKVAVVIPRYGLVGGAEGFARELCERLAFRTDFEIHVLANKWQSGTAPIYFHRVPSIRFPRFLRPIYFASFVQKHLKKNRYDLVHSHERIFQMDLLTVHGVPHRTWVKEAKRKRLSLFDRSTAWVEEKGIQGRRTPIVLPVSGLVKDELLKIYDIPDSKIHVIHPGVSTDRFSRLEKNGCRFEIRQRYGLSQNDLVVLFVGMNFEIKRLDLVMEGVANLVQKGNTYLRLKILVVGKGNIRKYKSIANGLGIGNRVAFVGVTKEVEKYYFASDIFALPSRFDAFPLVTLEAMIAGLPVIISGKVGTKDIIENGASGFVLGDNPSALDVSKNLAVLTHEEKRMKMGEIARRIALQHTWGKTADQVTQLYRQLGRVGSHKSEEFA